MPVVTRESINATVKVKLNSNIALPVNRYTCRIKKATFETSKSTGNPMVVLIIEIADPKEITIGDKVVAIAGVQLGPKYLSIDNSSDPVKAANAQEVFLKTREILGLPSTELDTENPQYQDFEGLLIDAKCGDDPQEQRQSPKPGQKQGDPILDPSGKPYPPKHFPKLIEILGKSAGTQSF